MSGILQRKDEISSLNSTSNRFALVIKKKKKILLVKLLAKDPKPSGFVLFKSSSVLKFFCFTDSKCLQRYVRETALQKGTRLSSMQLAVKSDRLNSFPEVILIMHTISRNWVFQDFKCVRSITYALLTF